MEVDLNPVHPELLLTTISQIYIAFLGLMSLFVVYRLESKANERRIIAERLRERPFVRYLFDGEMFYGITADDFHDTFQKALGKLPVKPGEEEKIQRFAERLSDFGKGVGGRDKYEYLSQEINRIGSSISFRKRLQMAFITFLFFHFFLGGHAL
jgi:hypothetical protein